MAKKVEEKEVCECKQGMFALKQKYSVLVPNLFRVKRVCVVHPLSRERIHTV